MFTSRSAWVYGAILLGIFLCGGCATGLKNPPLSVNDQAEALSAFSKSLLAHNAGDLETALHYCKQAIRNDPAEKALYSSAISFALELEKNDEALQLARQLRNERPNALPPRILEAEVCAATGQSEEAETLFRQLRTDFPQEPDSTIALARFLIAKKDFPEALGALKTAQKEHPQHAEILYMLGSLYVNRSQNVESQAGVKRTILKGIELLEEALSLNPDNPQHWRQLGHACLAVKDTAKAKVAFENARKQMPEDIRLARQLLDLYIESGDIERGLALCNELHRYTRTHPEIWFQYLAEKIPDEQQEALIEYLDEFLQEHPHSAAMYYTKLGSLYVEQDNLSGAQRILEKAQKIHPESSRIKTATGYLHLQLEHYEKAYAAFRQARTASPKPEWASSPLFILNFVTAAQMSGRVEEAADALSSAYENDPEVLTFYLRALSSDAPRVSSESAIELLEQFLARSPDGMDALYYLSTLRAEQKQYEEAIDHAQAFEKQASGTGNTNLLNGVFYYQYAVLHERTGRIDDAEPLFRKAIEMGPPPVAAAAQNYISYMWAERGEKLAMALELIQQALDAEPENAAFIDTLGWVYHMQGRYEEALVQLKKASELLQDDPIIWEHLGDIYLKLGNRKCAIKKWEKGLQADPDHQPLIDRLKENGLNSDNSPPQEDDPANTPPHP